MEQSFLPLSDEALRIAANLEQRHDAWIEAERRLEALPSSMFFSKKGAHDYLTVKRRAGDNGPTRGVRNASTEQKLASFHSERTAAALALTQTQAALNEIILQYRALKLPMAMPLPARILRELDIAELLGVDYMLVGTNAFAAYEIEAGCRFLRGADETEDFDLAWCRGSNIALSLIADGASSVSLLQALTAVDRTFRINARKPYQALNAAGYPVELLVAPSLFKTLPPGDAFSPAAIFPEQEWLLNGRPLRHVVASRDGRTCPIFAPDPRWMALHKMWLSRKTERESTKKQKDALQASMLLEAVRDRMANAYPLDSDFVLDLPEELRDLFNEWASANAFIPSRPGALSMR